MATEKKIEVSCFNCKKKSNKLLYNKWRYCSRKCKSVNVEKWIDGGVDGYIVGVGCWDKESRGGWDCDELMKGYGNCKWMGYERWCLKREEDMWWSGFDKNGELIVSDVGKSFKFRG